MPPRNPVLEVLSMLANNQPTVTLRSTGANRSTRSHPGQAKRSDRKRVLQAQKAAAEIAEATQLGITVDQLKKKKFDEVKHLFRDADKTSVRNTTMPEAYIRGSRDEARCPHCDRVNDWCETGINTCRRCNSQFIGKR